VKPIHLNLASRPYEDKRLFITTVVGISIVIAALLFVNIDTYLRYRVSTQTTRAKIQQLENEAQRERDRAESVKAQLAKIDTAALAKQTAFINAQLSQRAFSWSELLDRLEAVMADDVRLTSISPSFRPDGTVGLGLQLEAKTTDGLVNMLNRFNKDPQFANPFPSNESLVNGIYRISFSVDFKPSTVKTAAVQQ
jgi:Tfp pilus assembly protein PilN